MGFGGMGGYGGGFGMPQMGYGGMGGYGGGFGMPQMGYGLGSFGSQVGFGGYGNYGGFQPPQFATTDYKSPGMLDQIRAYQQNQQRNANQQPPPGMMLNPDYDAGYAMAQDMPFPGSEQWLRKQQFIPANPPANNPPPGMEMSQTTGWDPKFIGDLAPPPGWARQYTNPNPADIRITDGYFHGAQPNPPANNPPPGMELNPGYRGDDVIGMEAGPASMKYRLTQGANPSTGVMPSEPIPDPGGAYIPDETGQYDPNRGNYGQILQPTYSEPAPQIGSPIQPNQPRRMRNSMNMGIGSFFGGIGPSNFRNFYNP
jgi:hypothetical protein